MAFVENVNTSTKLNYLCMDTPKTSRFPLSQLNPTLTLSYNQIMEFITPNNSLFGQLVSI